jgi:hypothetical protein
VLTEFRAYKQAAIAGLAGGLPQLMVAVIDANRSSLAADLVRAMDLYRAGRACSSLKHFVDELRGRLKRLS